MENKKSQKANQQMSYHAYVQHKIPKPNYIKNCLWAFFVGGTICTMGQGINNYYRTLHFGREDAATITAIILIFLGALLTGFGIYDRIGKRAGAGSVVPITGFANSIVSPAMEFKREGYIFGVGGKMFILAGPVLVYGFGFSVIVGIVYYFLNI
ncbi:MAG: stage V sporulation protein AC [Thermotaleaceae bacterium]